MTAVDLCWALVRTTLATSATVCLAAVLLERLKIHAPRVHRATWALVILQGWLLVPWTVEIQTTAAPEVQRWQSAVQTPSTAIQSLHLADRGPAAMVAIAKTAPFDVSRPATFAWIAGAITLALVAAARYVRILRTLPLGAPLDDPHWQRQWQRQRRAMGVRARVDFRLTDRLGPLVAYIPPAYLLLAPRTAWTALNAREREAILRHELAHIRRRDLWKSLALRGLALPQWFNPLVWLAVRRFDEAAEWACDAAARRRRGGSQEVARALLRAAELIAFDTPKHGGAVIHAVPSNAALRRGSAFSRRIRRLVTPPGHQESTMRKFILPVLLASVAGAQSFRLEYVVAKPAAEPAVDAAKPAEEDSAASAAEADPAKRREYVESIWPRYIIEPPDILLIEGVKLVPKSPHQLQPFDVVLIRVVGALPEQPIDDTYSIDADGSVNLGPTYGRIKIAGDTIEEAEGRLREELAKKLTDVSVSASLVASAGAQQISGQHLVAMDGRVNLGVYGSVYVAGMTIEEARSAIEKKLSAQLEQPTVAVDVLAYNSKVYYVIYKGAKHGDNVTRLPITGNETVLDAVASMGGISSIATNTMWVARPAPNGVGPEKILPVAWNDIARGESSKTNYQLMPGDRLFIETQPAEPKPNQPYEKTPGSAANEESHRAYLVLKGYAAQDQTQSIELPHPLTDSTTVGSILASAVYPQPIDLAAANIELVRPGPDGKGLVRFAAWDIETGRTDPRSSLPVRPGDHIVVTAPKAGLSNISPKAIASPQPQAAPSPTSHHSPEAPPSGKVAMEIALIEDEKNTMAEFSELGTGILMRGDRATTLGALRALEKVKLIKLIKPTSPTVELNIGATTKIELGGQHAVISTRLLNPTALVIDVRTFQDNHEQILSVVLDSDRQESLIVKLHGAGDGDQHRNAYLVMLPRWTK